MNSSISVYHQIAYKYSFIFGLIQKSFGLSELGFNELDKKRIGIRSFSNFREIQTRIQTSNLMVK
jgi:hypothetical protein